MKKSEFGFVNQKLKVSMTDVIGLSRLPYSKQTAAASRKIFSGLRGMNYFR